LEVVLVFGEISPFARENASAMLESVREALSDQAIFVESEFHSWDVCNLASATAFNTAMITRRQGCQTGAIIVANFSDFLQRSGKFKEAQPQLEEVFRYFSARGHSALWIEPQTNDATAESGGLLKRVLDWFETKRLRVFGRHVPSEETPDSLPQTTVQVRHPLKLQETFPAHLAVLRFSLEQTP
jgi:hypothetical protein